MRKLTTVLILVLSIGSYAQQVKDSVPKITETERIIDKYEGKAVDAFNQVVEKAMPLAEEGIEIAVRLQIAKGIGFLVAALLCLFTIVKSLSKRVRVWANENGDKSLYLYLIFPVMGLLYWTQQAILLLVAPEWFAIKDIIGLVK